MLMLLFVVFVVLVVLALLLGGLLWLRKKRQAGQPVGVNWFRDYWIHLVVGALVVLGIVALLFWGVPSVSAPPSLSLESPDLKTVWAGTKFVWLWALLGCIGMFVLGSVFPRFKILQGLSLLAFVLLFVVFPILGWITGPSTPSTHATRTEVPLASSPQSSWPKLVIPAGGKSELIAVPPGMHIVMNGNNFRVHNVYTDGKDCAFGESCIAGPLVGNYAKNEAQTTNIVVYAFAPN